MEPHEKELIFLFDTVWPHEWVMIQLPYWFYSGFQACKALCLVSLTSLREEGSGQPLGCSILALLLASWYLHGKGQWYQGNQSLRKLSSLWSSFPLSCRIHFQGNITFFPVSMEPYSNQRGYGRWMKLVTDSRRASITQKVSLMTIHIKGADFQAFLSVSIGGPMCEVSQHVFCNVWEVIIDITVIQH